MNELDKKNRSKLMDWPLLFHGGVFSQGGSRESDP